MGPEGRIRTSISVVDSAHWPRFCGHGFLEPGCLEGDWLEPTPLACASVHNDTPTETSSGG